MRTCLIVAVFVLLTLPLSALAVPSLVDEVADGVYVVHDDTGNWGKDWSKSVTHMSSAPYLAKKILDLSDVPAEVWDQTRTVRLSVCLSVRDYSWHDNPEANGLDEAIEIQINGKAHEYPTNAGQPVYLEAKANALEWWDVPIARDEFVRGPNEIILHKAPSDKNDDYLYLGIDHGNQRGNSSVAFDGKTWLQDKLTIPGGNGEYMVRLYLIQKETSVRVIWEPGENPRLDDPADLIDYAGARAGQPAAGGMLLPQGHIARIEWDARKLDKLQPVKALVEADGDIQYTWLKEDGSEWQTGKGASPLESILGTDRAEQPSGLLISPAADPVTLKSVTIETAMAYHPIPEPIDMCPAIAQPKGKPAQVRPSCSIGDDALTLRTANLRCRFDRGERLRLASLFNEYTQTEMVREPDSICLFMVEVGEKRYAGSRDFTCSSVKPDANGGFVAELLLKAEGAPSLKATLTAGFEDESLRMGLEVTNAGEQPVDFKLAFPHLAGLAVSENPSDDYYFYPYGGGIYASTPATIRSVYGDHQALYQVMDLYGPALGGGLSIQALDTEGWHKTLALRKYIPGENQTLWEPVRTRTAPEYRWTSSFEDVEGTAFAYEYDRRTRKPGESFSPSAVALAAHSGDWHDAMQAYADWAHKVWKFRPYPSRLTGITNMIAAGWGQGILFRDGAYRTDIIQEPKAGIGQTMTDCIELMSWWDWSPVGPWSTPFDKLPNVLSEATLKMWEPYFVKDPVTGEQMWNNQPGDYDGYNERFGGLPAFRNAIETYRDMGSLVTLYTDPFRLDDASKSGQAHGKEWGVVGPDGEHSKGYEVWNPCHDDPDVREWVAETMERVMRETGADGIRLDEYGHQGWACFSDLHEHTYSERGVSQWQKAVAEATRMVHEGMDRVRPDLVLTTEHPGYDYLMQYLEGCITYDVTVLAAPLRPLECNIQRFYFPECKPYELDHRGKDNDFRKRFWNGGASFGRHYFTNMYQVLRENEDVFAGPDCAPLIPTTAQFVYANRFGAGEKVLYHLYNATGHTFDGPALAVDLGADEHLFDLLECREVVPVDGLAQLYLPRNEVASVAKLPKLIAWSSKTTIAPVREKLPEGELLLVVASVNGEELLSQPFTAGENAVDFSALPETPKAACVKLIRDGILLDAISLDR